MAQRCGALWIYKQTVNKVEFPRTMSLSFNPRAAKRQRITSYHDSVPIDDNSDYDVVYHREGLTRRLGNEFISATLSRSAAPDHDLWASKVTWAPQDNAAYALNADGAGFEDAVEVEVMQDEGAIRKKYTRSRVSVSRSFSACLSFHTL